MNSKAFLIFCIPVLLFSTGVFPAETATEEKEAEAIIQPERHISKEGGYSIQFPADWKVMKGVMGTDVIALAPSKDPEDLFRENVNVIFAKLDMPIEREEYYTFNLRSLAQLLVDFDLEENQDVVLDGVDAKKIIFTHTMGVVNAKVLQYLILDGDRAYVLTFTADPLDFDSYREDFEKIGNSFKFEEISEKDKGKAEVQQEEPDEVSQ